MGNYSIQIGSSINQLIVPQEWFSIIPMTSYIFLGITNQLISRFNFYNLAKRNFKFQPLNKKKVKIVKNCYEWGGGVIA